MSTLFIADLPTETLIVPNTEWNNLPENKNSQNVLHAGCQGFESLAVHHFFRHLAEDAFFVVLFLLRSSGRLRDFYPFRS